MAYVIEVEVPKDRPPQEVIDALTEASEDLGLDVGVVFGRTKAANRLPPASSSRTKHFTAGLYSSKPEATSTVLNLRKHIGSSEYEARIIEV